MSEQRRTIRLFVSSTFLDMQAERDLLQREIFPQLKRFCLDRGLHFQSIDLRWGVSEEASRHNRTMRICLRELDRCQQGGLKPNFLILLGERYGWCPLPEVIPADLFNHLRPAVESYSSESARALAWYRLDQNAVPPAYVILPRENEMADYDLWHKDVEVPLLAVLKHACANARMDGSLSMEDLMRLENLAIGTSATHQEIVNGALKVDDAADHVHAFVRRHVADASANPEIDALVRQIGTSVGSDNVHLYDQDLAEFGHKVLRSLTAIIEREAARLNQISAIEEESALHQRLRAEYKQNFQGQREAIKRIMDYIDHGNPQPLVVLGGSGTGKSALMAQAAHDAQARGFIVVERFIGASPRSVDVLTLLSDIAAEIRRGCTEKPEDTSNNAANLKYATDALRKAVQAAKAEKPIALFLDGLNELSEGSYGRKLNWLPRQLPAFVKLVVSCTMPSAESDPTDPRHEVYYAIASRFAQEDCVLTERLSEQDGSALLDAWLAEKNRQLQPAQRTAILQTFMRQGNALWLKVAAIEAAKMFSWAEPPCLPEAVVELIRQILHRMAEPLEHGQKLVEHAVGYLSAARRGLSESDLIELLSEDADVMQEFRQRFPKAPKADQLPITVWVALRGDLEAYLSESEQYGMTLLSFSQSSFRESIFKGEMGNARECHRILADYFRRQEVTARTLEELPWQLVRGANWDGLAELLSKPQSFSDLFRLSRSDAKFYWTCLERNSQHKMPEVFADVIRNPGIFLPASLDVADLMDETAYLEEARRLLEGIIGQCRYPEDVDLYLACMIRLGILQMKVGKYEECEETFRTCKRTAQMSNRRELQGAALLNLAIAQRKQRRLDRADMLVNVYLEDEYKIGLGKAYETKASIAEDRNDYTTALEWFDKALKEAEESGDDDLRSEVLEHRAWLLAGQGKVPQGEYDLSQVANHYGRTGDLIGSANAHSRIGILEKDRGNLTAALDQYQHAAEFEHQMGRPVNEAMLLDNRAEALIRMYRMADALPLNLEAIRIFREYKAEQQLAIALLNHAVLQGAMGNQEAAEGALAEARSLSRQIGDNETMGRVLALEAEMLRYQKKFKEAERAGIEAIRVLEAAGVKDALAKAHGELGVLLAENLGRTEEALSEFETAIEIGKQRDLQSYMILLLQQIAAIYEQMGDDDVVLDASKELATIAARRQDAEAGTVAMLFSSTALSRLRRYTEALDSAKKGVVEAKRTGIKKLLAAAQLTLAMRLRDCGESNLALAESLEAESTHEAVEDWDGVVRSRLFRAQLLNFDLGRKEEAVELLASAIVLDRELSGGLRQENLQIVQDAIRGNEPLDRGEKK